MLPLLLLLTLRIQPDDATLPARQPQLAAGQGLTALAFGSGSSIYFAGSQDNGKSFHKPVKVAELGALALGRHRGPRVAVLPGAIVITAIAAERKATGPHAHGLPEQGNLYAWRSTDSGATWKQTVTVNDVPGAAREGLHAMAARPDGSLVAVWLDLRTSKTQLYSSLSTDGGLTWSKNALVYASPDGTICECCHPTLGVDGKGAVWAMWRNVLDGGRDLYVTSSPDGRKFQPAMKLGTGTWKINACPMDGGNIAFNKRGIVSAWRRGSEIYVTDSKNNEQLIGPGKDVTLAQNRDATILSWTHDGAVKLRKLGSKEDVLLSPEGGFPALLPQTNGSILAAWETPKGIETSVID
jgi:hypothetical protein